MEVGVHQGSALSPFLFIMVMDVLIEDVRDGSLVELYAVVLCGKSLSEVKEKYGRWKNAVEGKGLRVNVDKTTASVVSGLFAILFSVQNFRGGFIVVVLVCLGR